MPSLLIRPMHVQIVLDSPQSTWTNLDTLHGHVHLRLFGPTPLSSIVMKLEGESKTRLRAPVTSTTGTVPGAYDNRGWDGERSVMREETHKILYRTSVIFPRDQATQPVGGKQVFTLNQGDYNFPFSFKIPINNACEEAAVSAASSLAHLARSSLKSPAVSAPVRHTKRTLPPTLTTFPGLAEIRYYVKVTVNRKEFYKENPRIVQNLTFFPIEPPRSTPTGAETYARRQHQFTPATGFAPKGKAKLFDAFKKNSNTASSSRDSSDPPLISIDARLPSPPILTCSEDLPLRLIVRKLNSSDENLYLQSLHIQLHGITRIRANDVQREESSNWVILSRSNMGMPLSASKTRAAGKSSEKSENNTDDEITIDAGHWRRHPLPNSVSPTFETCNISRQYELEVHVGISSRTGFANNTVVIPLRHPVQVYSGIAPPPALLAAMSNRKVPDRKPVKPSRPEKSSAFTAPPHLRTDVGSSAIPSTAQSEPSTPVEPPASQFGPLPPGEEEPPPSYEDAVAQDVPAVAGPRHEYQPPPMRSGGFMDEKGRRDS